REQGLDGEALGGPEREEGEGDAARARGRGVRARLESERERRGDGVEGQDDQAVEALSSNPIEWRSNIIWLRSFSRQFISFRKRLSGYNVFSDM
ncbi:hypothetical protein THAOC_30833, partial [Thalassiosira oceanica]